MSLSHFSFGGVCLQLQCSGRQSDFVIVTKSNTTGSRVHFYESCHPGDIFNPGKRVSYGWMLKKTIGTQRNAIQCQGRCSMGPVATLSLKPLGVGVALRNCSLWCFPFCRCCLEPFRKILSSFLKYRIFFFDP